MIREIRKKRILQNFLENKNSLKKFNVSLSHLCSFRIQQQLKIRAVSAILIVNYIVMLKKT